MTVYSFRHHTNKALEYANRGTKEMTGYVTSYFSSPESQRWLLYGVIIPAALFVLLSPGLIVNIPLNTKGRCAKLVPFPDQVITNNCESGTPDTEIVPICKARQNCNSFWVSGYTSIGPIIVHAFVFVFIALFVMALIRRGSK